MRVGVDDAERESGSESITEENGAERQRLRLWMMSFESLVLALPEIRLLLSVYFCLPLLMVCREKCKSEVCDYQEGGPSHRGLIWSCPKSLCSFNIPRAKRELAQLNRCTSPQQKLACLRKVVQLITQSPSQRGVCSGKGLAGRWLQKSRCKHLLGSSAILKGHRDGLMCSRVFPYEHPRACSAEWVPSNGGRG